MAATKTVLPKAEAEKVAVNYSPRKFPASISRVASDFVAFNTGNVSSFQIDQIVAQQTGIAELERVSIEERVEREALGRVKEIQEQAYAQAYQLGLEEGREKAFKDQRVVFAQHLENFQRLLGTIENLKGDLVASNETQILRLVVYMSRRLAMTEIAERPELVLQVIRQAVESAQTDEAINVRVSPADHEFIETIREKLGKEFDSLKRATFEASEEISSGGCIVETNYGDVDATMEQRFDKLWLAVSEKLPKVTNIVGG